MQITINKKQIDLSVTKIEESKSEATFSFLHGRRFTIEHRGQVWLKNISLNDFIEAVNEEAGKKGQDIHEVKSLLHLFNTMKDQGYSGPDSSIKKENFLVQLITKIKHFFSEGRRTRLLNELTQAVKQAESTHNNPTNRSESSQPVSRRDSAAETSDISTDLNNLGFRQLDPSSDYVYEDEDFQNILPGEQFPTNDYIPPERQNRWQNFPPIGENNPPERRENIVQNPPQREQNWVPQRVQDFVPQGRENLRANISEARQDNFEVDFVPEIIEDEPEQGIDVVSFGLLNLDGQIEFLKKLSPSSLLAFYQDNPQFQSLIDNNFATEYKKAQRSSEAFTKWKDHFKNCIYSLGQDNVLNHKIFENLIKEFLPDFSKEMISVLEELFAYSKDNPVSTSLFMDLIKVTKAISPTYKGSVARMLKNAINDRLQDRQTIRQDQISEVLECIKTLATISSHNIREYKNLLQAYKGNVTRQETLPLLEVLGIIDLSNLQSESSLFRADNTLPEQRKKAAMIRNLIDKAQNFAKIFSFVNRFGDEYLKSIGMCQLLKVFPEHSQKIEIEIQRNSTSDKALTHYALSYAQFGQLEKAFAFIDEMVSSLDKGLVLIEMAQFYADKDTNKTLRILSKIDLRSMEGSDLVEMAKLYAPIDIEKAREICNRIRSNKEKIKALAILSNEIKNTNGTEASQIWENILRLAPQVQNDNKSEPYLSLLEVVRQKAEMDPLAAKQFFEEKLQNLPEHFTRKGLLENMLGTQSSLWMQNFKHLIRTYVAIDPVETEDWLSEYASGINPNFQAVALLALRDNL